MPRWTWWPLLAAAVAGAACAPRPTPPADPPARDPPARDPLTPEPPPPGPTARAGAGGCDAAGAQRFVGMGGSAATLAAAGRAAHAARVRSVRPGQAMTMDYRTDRLTVRLGADGAVRSLRCN